MWRRTSWHHSKKFPPRAAVFREPSYSKKSQGELRKLSPICPIDRQPAQLRLINRATWPQFPSASGFLTLDRHQHRYGVERTGNFKILGAGVSWFDLYGVFDEKHMLVTIYASGFSEAGQIPDVTRK